MAIEIRSAASADELRTGMKAGATGFGEELLDDEFERHVKTMPPDRFLTAFDGAAPVGTTASYAFTVTIPGGELPAAGVTWVTVLPSHRRRGILTQFMRHQLDDVHERGEPLAILWASEAVIYGRFGYGVAAPTLALNADRSRFALRSDADAAGTVRLVGADEAEAVLPPLHEHVRREIPGMVARSPDWWTTHRLADPERWRRGAGPKFWAVYERDGAPQGYAQYRIKEDWDEGFSRSELRVHEAFGLTPEATREVWRFLFGIDLIERVRGSLDPGSQLFLSVLDPRSLRLRVGEGLWLRLVDVEAALRARTYAAGDAVVLDVGDDACAWNVGRYRIGAEVERTDDAPDVELDVADLASAYLGAFDFHALARAGRARERTPGALERASALFRTTRPPFCSEDF
ncbi:MAG: GNAT family N-acetyltransferase [Gaiellaceae bacterium]|jgi:predicted acetyltransferase